MSQDGGNPNNDDSPALKRQKLGHARLALARLSAATDLGDQSVETIGAAIMARARAQSARMMASRTAIERAGLSPDIATLVCLWEDNNNAVRNNGQEKAPFQCESSKASEEKRKLGHEEHQSYIAFSTDSIQDVNGDTSSTDVSFTRNNRSFDLISELASTHELAVELCKALPFPDILTLYSVSRTFHTTINDFLLSTITQVIAVRAPESGRAMPWSLYRELCIPDPAGRLPQARWATYPNEAPRLFDPPVDLQAQPRLVPSLRYLGMILGRERMVGDIVASLARAGHRTPRTMTATLKKLWTLLDCGYNRGRRAMISSRAFFSDIDVYNTELFALKLVMRFNDPLRPLAATDSLAAVLLGQRAGLYPLWCMLLGKNGYDSLKKCVQLKVRYDYLLPRTDWRPHVFGVPLAEVGIHHLEGWGTGAEHLLRPDELAQLEAARRGIALDDHEELMLLWGYRDWKTGRNLVPTQEEMHMHDPDLPEAEGTFREFGNVPFRNWEWQPWQSMKARWAELTNAEKLAVWRHQEDEKLRAMPFMEDCEPETDEEQEEEDDGGVNIQWTPINKPRKPQRPVFVEQDSDTDSDTDTAYNSISSSVLDTPAAPSRQRTNKHIFSPNTSPSPASRIPRSSFWRLSSFNEADLSLADSFLAQMELPLAPDARLRAQADRDYDDAYLDFWDSELSGKDSKWWGEEPKSNGSRSSSRGSKGETLSLTATSEAALPVAVGSQQCDTFDVDKNFNVFEALRLDPEAATAEAALLPTTDEECMRMRKEVDIGKLLSRFHESVERDVFEWRFVQWK
jgi:hypothetical protein